MMAAHRIRFHNVEDQNEGSDDLDVARLARPRNGILHDRPIVNPKSASRPAKPRAGGHRRRAPFRAQLARP